MKFYPTLAALVFFAGTLAPSLGMSQDFRDSVQESASRWDKIFNSGDAAAVADLYASDATLLPAGSPAVSGEQNIEQFWASLIEKGFGSHKIDVQSAKADGDMGYAYGRWQAIGPGADGAQTQYQGNWLNVLQRQGNEWRTVLHAWN